MFLSSQGEILDLIKDYSLEDLRMIASILMEEVDIISLYVSEEVGLI